MILATLEAGHAWDRNDAGSYTHAQTASGELSIASVDRESEPFGQIVQVNSEPILLTDVGPVVVETAPKTNPEVTAPAPHAGSFSQDEVVVAPDKWIVQADDHLWTIAEQVLDAAGKPTDDATAAPTGRGSLLRMRQGSSPSRVSSMWGRSSPCQR